MVFLSFPFYANLDLRAFPLCLVVAIATTRYCGGVDYIPEHILVVVSVSSPVMFERSSVTSVFFFLCVCPVIDDKLRHNIVKVLWIYNKL